MEFREDKLAGLLAYLASMSAEDQHFSVVKAAKLVAAIDFAAFARRGVSVTGDHYIKLEAGPVPRHFDPTLNLLKAKGQLEVKRTVFRGRDQKRILATPSAEWGSLSSDDIRLADEKHDQHRTDTAADIRDVWHEFPGWALVRMRQDIPLHTALITLAGPTDQDYRDSEALAERFGWS